MEETDGFCIDREAFDAVVKFFSALNCVVDFMCAGIPFEAMRTVNLDRKTRYGLYAILCCGIVTAACSIGRAVSLDFKSPDPTYKLVPLSYWTAAEMYGAIIFASLPALRQLLSLVKRKLTSSEEDDQTARGKRRWWRRESRPQEPAHSGTTIWTYSPDSGGFRSFMGSDGRTIGAHASPTVTRELTRPGDEGPMSLAEMLNSDHNANRRSTLLATTMTASSVGKKPDSHIELGQVERGETSGRTTSEHDLDDEESLRHDRAGS